MPPIRLEMKPSPSQLCMCTVRHTYSNSINGRQGATNGVLACSSWTFTPSLPMHTAEHIPMSCLFLGLDTQYREYRINSCQSRSCNRSLPHVVVVPTSRQLRFGTSRHLGFIFSWVGRISTSEVDCGGESGVEKHCSHILPRCRFSTVRCIQIIFSCVLRFYQ